MRVEGIQPAADDGHELRQVAEVQRARAAASQEDADAQAQSCAPARDPERAPEAEEPPDARSRPPAEERGADTIELSSEGLARLSAEEARGSADPADGSEGLGRDLTG